MKKNWILAALREESPGIGATRQTASFDKFQLCGMNDWQAFQMLIMEVLVTEASDWESSSFNLTSDAFQPHRIADASRAVDSSCLEC